MRFEVASVMLMDADGQEYAPYAILLWFAAAMIDTFADGAALPYLGL